MLKSVIKEAGSGKYRYVDQEKYKDIPDEEIIQYVVRGYSYLFEVIMRRYNQRLYRIQRSYISDEDAIQDTMQTTYIKAFENLNQFRGDSKFSTWITRIAINEALKYLNRRKKRSRLFSVQQTPENTGGTPAVNEHSPEERAIQKEYRNLLEQTLDELPPKYRAVYIMREIEQISTRETADCMGITASNVKVRLHRAKKMLREALEKQVRDTEIFNFLGKECDLLVSRVMQLIESRY